MERDTRGWRNRGRRCPIQELESGRTGTTREKDPTRTEERRVKDQLRMGRKFTIDSRGQGTTPV